MWLRPSLQNQGFTMHTSKERTLGDVAKTNLAKRI